MKNVVHIDPSEVIAQNQSRIAGGKIFVSPANTPEYVESDYDKQQSEFTIHFVYPGTERLVQKAVDQNTYFVGEISGRLYGMRIKTNPHDTQQLSRDLKKILSTIAEPSNWQGSSRWGRGSVDAVSSILSLRREEILKPRFG